MHDYDISWDYMLDDLVSKENNSLLKRIVKDIKKEILPILKAFDNFEVYPIILADGQIGVYCRGTCEEPVIGVDIGNTLIGCDKYNTSLELSLKTTILHELKHAWQEWHSKDFDEVEAEEFAFNHSGRGSYNIY